MKAVLIKDSYGFIVGKFKTFNEAREFKFSRGNNPGWTINSTNIY